MGWINLVAEGPRLKALAETYFNFLRQSPGELEIGRMAALTALMVGESALYREALGFASDEFETLKRRPERDWGSIAVLPDLIGLSVLFHNEGHDQTDLWKQIAALRRIQDRHMQALQQIVIWLLDSTSRSKRAFVPGPGPIRGLAGLLRVLDKAPLRYLFDAVISPDNPDWAFDLDSFVLPLGQLLLEELRVSDQSVDLSDILYCGAFPERRRDIVYRRQWPRPAWNTQPVAGQPETWFGFDAVEFASEELWVYHYLTLKWQAPLLFEPGANAFAFLDQLPASWQFVEEYVTSEQSHRISNAIARNNVLHIVVHDSTMAPVLPAALGRAAEHYTVKLVTKDVTEV